MEWLGSGLAWRSFHGRSLRACTWHGREEQRGTGVPRFLGAESLQQTRMPGRRGCGVPTGVLTSSPSPMLNNLPTHQNSLLFYDTTTAIIETERVAFPVVDCYFLTAGDGDILRSRNQFFPKPSQTLHCGWRFVP